MGSHVLGDRVGKRILVCRGGALGDLVVTLPVLQALRQAWPQAELDLLAYPRHAVLAQACGLAQGVRSLDDAGVAAWFDPSAQDLPAEEASFVASYDRVLCLLHDPGDVVRGKLQRVGKAPPVCHSPLVTSGHAVDHFLRALLHWGITVHGTVPRLELPAEIRAQGRARLRNAGGATVILQPGSGSPLKNWPLDRYRALAERLAARHGRSPVFLLGEAERAWEERLAAAFPVLSRLSVLEAAGVLAAGTLYVGNDSGATHLAAAVGTRVLALFGPTDPAVWGPRGERVNVVRADPPTTAGLQALDVATVEAAIRSLPQA